MGDMTARRIIEVGPSRTLVNMMKTTWKQGFLSSDDVQGLRRFMLGSNADKDQVYYRFLPAADPDVHEDTEVKNDVSTRQFQKEVSTGICKRPPGETAPIVSKVPVQTTVGSGPISSVGEVQTSVIEVMTTLIAVKLKKRRRDLDLDVSISRLVGGEPGRCYESLCR